MAATYFEQWLYVFINSLPCKVYAFTRRGDGSDFYCTTKIHGWMLSQLAMLTEKSI